MDPDAALRGLLQAIAAGERAKTMVALDILSHWLRHGGFMPVNAKETAKEVFNLEEPRDDDDDRW